VRAPEPGLEQRGAARAGLDTRHTSKVSFGWHSTKRSSNTAPAAKEGRGYVEGIAEPCYILERTRGSPSHLTAPP